MATPKLQAVSTVQGYIKSINSDIDQVAQSKRDISNYLMSTCTELQYGQAMATVHTSTINAIELLTTELSEKQAYLAKLKKSIR
jgi:hypothetical protein